MNTVFIGGSRHISRLSARVQKKLDNIVAKDLRVVIGDAPGADKAIQKFLANASYNRVAVFCSGEKPRNNLGDWEVHPVKADKGVKGFEYYALKDREMAKRADFGLMIWDGESPGTVLNVLRLVNAGRKAVLIDCPNEREIKFSGESDWRNFLAERDSKFVASIRDRATTEEWNPNLATRQKGLFDSTENRAAESNNAEERFQDGKSIAAINAALAVGDMAAVIRVLGDIAKSRGMSDVAKNAGLARESLYRSLGDGGNPEFTTIIKVIISLGLRLSVAWSTGYRNDITPAFKA